MAFSLGQFVGALTAVGPVVLMLVPGGAAFAPLIPLIVKGIGDAQASRKTGPEKRQYVIDLVDDAAQAVNVAKPGTIDTALLVQSVGHGVDAVIGAINSIQIAQIALPDVPALLAAPTKPV